MAGGLTGAGDLPDWVLDRVMYSVKHATRNDTLIFSSRYTLNLPPKIDPTGYPICEAKEMLKAYKSLGGLSTNLLLEVASTDTIGSAVFLRLLYSSILENETVLVITSDFHVDRVKNIFDKVFTLQPALDGISLQFKSCTTKMHKEKRMQHERRSIETFREQFGSILTMEDFLKEFLTKHTNYNYQYGSQGNYDDTMLY